MAMKPLVLTERVQFMISGEMARRIDAYRRHHPDLPNRSEACRHLIEAGLKAQNAASKKPPSGRS